MLIGVIEIPNKWAIDAEIRHKSFLYLNENESAYSIDQMGGGSIFVPPFCRNLKIISQNDSKFTEYWCLQLLKENGEYAVVPIGMKRFGYSNLSAKFFLFKAGIETVFSLTQPNYTCNPDRLSVGEYFLNTLDLVESLSSSPYNEISLLWNQNIIPGDDLMFFQDGQSISLSNLLRRCCLVNNYSKSSITQIDEMTSPSDFRIKSRQDILNILIDYTPYDPYKPGQLDLDWIGECIIQKSLSEIHPKAIASTVCSNSITSNIMRTLYGVSKQEELVVVPNLTMTQFGTWLSDSDRATVQENIDEVITALSCDEATTLMFTYEAGSNQLSVQERVYGYGRCSSQNYPTKNGVPMDDIYTFSFESICEYMGFVKIQCIKTYNEELFMTVWLRDGRTESYYFNILIHSLVSGSLFAL